MRRATVVLVCALPLGGGCVREDNPAPWAGLHGGNQELARFEDVVRQTAHEREHTAVALAAGPDRLVWAVAVSEPTVAVAKALAMSRCMTRVKQDRVPASCAIYAIDGRPRFLDDD
jgi:hypothetical protein